MEKEILARAISAIECYCEEHHASIPCPGCAADIATLKKLMDQKIYVINYFVNQHHPRKGGWDQIEHGMRVVFGNLDRAKSTYRELRGNVERWSDFRNYLGRCVLFEAFVYDNGDLSTYPKSGYYIEQTAMNCGAYPVEEPQSPKNMEVQA